MQEQRRLPSARAHASLAIILMLLSGALPRSAHAESATVASITDGDTFRTTTGERIRIAGIDAPETQQGQARCPFEIRRGRAATTALSSLVQGRAVALNRIGNSYNRTVAHVRLGDLDIGQEMIRLGAAQPWPRGEPKPSWCDLNR